MAPIRRREEYLPTAIIAKSLLNEGGNFVERRMRTAIRLSSCTEEDNATSARIKFVSLMHREYAPVAIPGKGEFRLVSALVQKNLTGGIHLGCKFV